MSSKRKVSIEKAYSVGARLGINWTQIGLEEFRRGLEIELEHSAHDPGSNVTGDEFDVAGKIVWAHLKEMQDA
jgi:hypothetical protein